MIYEHLYAKCNSADGRSSVWSTAGYSPELPEELIRQVEHLCRFEIDPAATEPEHAVRFLPLQSGWFVLTFITTMPNGNALDTRPSAVFHNYLFGREDAMTLFADRDTLQRLFCLPHITAFPAGAVFTPSGFGPAELMVRAELPAAAAQSPAAQDEATLQKLFLQAVVCESQTGLPGILLAADNGSFAQHADTIIRCLLRIPASLRITCGFHTCCRATSELAGLRMAFCSEETLLQFRENRFDGAPAAQWMLYAPALQLIHADGGERAASAANRICLCHTAEDFAVIDRLLTDNPNLNALTFVLYIQAFMQWQNGGMSDNMLVKAPAELPLDWLAARCRTTGEVCVLFPYALELGTAAGTKLADACAVRLGSNALPVLLAECTDPKQEKKIRSYFRIQEPVDPAAEKAAKAVRIATICMAVSAAVLVVLIGLFAFGWYTAKLSAGKIALEALRLLLVIAASFSLGVFHNLRSQSRKRLSRSQNSQD